MCTQTALHCKKGDKELLCPILQATPHANKIQHKVVTQRGTNEEVSTKKKIGRGQHMSSQRTTPHKTTVRTKQTGSLQLQCGVVCMCVLHYIVQCVHTRQCHVQYYKSEDRAE